MRLEKEAHRAVIDDLARYFEVERGEHLGSIEAEQLLDFFNKQLANYYYNQGVEDARRLVEDKVLNLDEDLRAMMRVKK